ncbi:hypothetical protein H0H87_012315 [Tephrocybe sp. NHM501043]|nr:hypothetical protein H0H87_012315 [Tephrocybe sp. NHM501043]
MAPQSVRQSLSSLPHEILDDILSELDEVNDLLSLAFTSRRNANVIIPQHTQYRNIRIRTPMPAMWAHLAQRADLTRNIRRVELCTRQDHTASDRFPFTLVYGSTHHEDEKQRVDDICTALGHMKRLATFVWDYEPDVKSGRWRLNHSHEEMIISSLVKAPSLRHLMLRGECGAHVRDGKGTLRQPYPLWNITGLNSLSLLGTAWTNRSNSEDIIRLLQASPNLEYLEIPMELRGLETCRLPRLKKVGLPMTSGAATTNVSGELGVVADPVIGFLQSNPSVEELNWSPTLTMGLPNDALPNLRCLSGNYAVIRRLEMPGTTPRPIECLDLWDVASDRLHVLPTFDACTLRKLRIGHVCSPVSLYAIAEKFAGITWLRLPAKCMHRFFSSAFELPRLLDILTCFTNLEVFRGPALWEAVGGETQKERMHDAILDLVERCPRLRQLDHSSSSVKRKAVKLIKIYRKEAPDGKVEQVWYEIHRPPSGRPEMRADRRYLSINRSGSMLIREFRDLPTPVISQSIL